MIRTHFFICFAALAFITARPALAAPLPANWPTEYWVNEEQGWVVETKPCDSGLCGYLVGFRIVHPHAPDYVPIDDHNPDPAHRADPLCGMLLMGGFNPSDRPDGVLEGGWIYDPDNGKTYSGIISILDADRVKLRGYVGVPLFGRTISLHRETGITTRCAAPPSS